MNDMLLQSFLATQAAVLLSSWALRRSSRFQASLCLLV